MALYELYEHREIESPVLVIGMEGWIDAGLAAGGAIAALLGSLPTQTLATFDGDELIDQRARRPVVRLVDGVNTALTWPEIQLRSAEDRLGNDVLLLVGPEPDIRWRAFTGDVVELAGRFGVRLVVGLGGFPAPAPHTRPVRLAATATTSELAAQVGFVPGTMDVPGGVQAALERGFADAGVPAVGLWARVPHYVSNLPYPAASLALVEGLAQLSGLLLETRELRSAAALSRQRIDELIANNADHTDMVRQLETQVDNEEQSTMTRLDQANLPSGEEIAAELERFLRDQSS
jgi:predicted ATP-grasp superfamily ATP-dependent carboligase